MFLCPESEKFNNHQITPELCSLSDHTPLLVSITIKEEFIHERRQTIVKDSEEENKFINKLRYKISNIDISNILNGKALESIT